MMIEDFELEQLDIDSAMEELSKDLKDDKDGLDDADVSSEALAAAALLDMTSESDIEELAASSEAMDEVSEMMGVAMERTIVRFDRKARLAHLSKQAELDAARQAGDPNYKKLVKIWMMERALEKKIHQRWASKAKSVASKKIRDYAANGKKIAKPNPSTVAFKGKVSSKIAQSAVNRSKKMFSNGNQKKA